jgi:hypothetical protein
MVSEPLIKGELWKRFRFFIFQQLHNVW